jgi:ABC-type nitrate/sulfonate/bicarbonate transport system substrate-binding protein
MKLIRIVFAILSALNLLTASGCDSSKPKESFGRPVERLTLGTLSIDQSSLIWVAKGQGYFSDQGLDIEIIVYDTGNLAIQDLFAGKLDLATASEFGVLRCGLQFPDIRIVSILDEAQDQVLVARRDRGITQLSDLLNKRIGVALNTCSEYYLALLLLLEKIRPEDVTIVDLLPSKQIKAITEGDIDAAIVWEPFGTIAKKKLGTNAVSWPGQSGQDEYWLLCSTQGTLQKRFDAVRRFVAALASAESFIKDHRDRAMGIVAKELGEFHVRSSWKNHRFGLGLHRPLVLKMEAELEWLKSGPAGLPSDKLDVYDFIYVDALRSVARGKIEMIQ